jgi:hypothetical protein
MERAEGKIKADGTIARHRAQISWSAHCLGDGARHRPKTAQCRAFAEVNVREAFRGTMDNFVVFLN